MPAPPRSPGSGDAAVDGDDVGYDVAIVLVPRETVRGTGAALDRLRASRPARARIVAVDVDGRGDISDAARADPFVEVISTRGFVLPFAARNLALASNAAARAAFVVFVDTNAIPAVGCIEALVAAARETGAGCVHPLILVRHAGRERVHAARCVLATESLAGEPGDSPRRFHPRIEGMGAAPSSVPMTRAVDDYGELHLVLFSRRALEVIAPFPALSLAEDIAIALRLRGAGLRSILEPRARASYIAEGIDDALDRAYFRFRWDARAAHDTIDALRSLPIADAYWREKQAWLRRHRRHAQPAYRAALQVARLVNTRARESTPTSGRVPSGMERSVDVVIPARGASSFVAEAVASARADDEGQGPVVARVIVVVDGHDPAASAAARSAGADVVLELPTAMGAAAARNAGARKGGTREESKAAPWLLFLDADDRLRPGAVARLLDLAMANRAVVAYGEAAPMDVSGRRVGPDRRSWFASRPGRGETALQLRRALLAGNPIATTGAALLSRDAFARVGGFPEGPPRAHDWALWCRLATTGAFAYVPATVVDRRWHARSISSTIGLSMQSALPAIDLVFSDAHVVAGIPPAELDDLRRRQEASALALAATERLKIDDVSGARPLLVGALWRQPRVREAVLLAFSLAGTVPASVRRRLR